MTTHESNKRSQWRAFSEARASAHALKLKNRQAWRTYCQSSQKPDDIPASPDSVYKDFVSWQDWLGTANRSYRSYRFRPFEQARAFVRTLNLKNRHEWKAYCQSDQRPDDIPTNPGRAYKGEYKSLGDWLGTGFIATHVREYLPFLQARALVHTLGLKAGREWRDYCASEQKPDNIPSAPRQVYKEEYKGMSDWLGTGKQAPGRHFLPFEDARKLVHSLQLRTSQDWVEYCASGARPSNIPANPWTVYTDEFKGMADWLGFVNRWSRKGLLAFLENLRQHLPCLSEQELYVILQQECAFPALCSAFGGVSPLQALQEIMYQDEQETNQACQDRGQQAEFLDEHSASNLLELEGNALGLDGVVDGLLDQHASETEHIPSLATLSSDAVPLLTQGYIQVVDQLSHLSIELDAETAEFLVVNRVSRLWEAYTNGGWISIEPILNGEGGSFFTTIKARFLTEVEAVNRLEIPEGWSFTNQDGTLATPNIMQRRTAWEVREKRRVGNWSGTGAGKTLAAILASRVIEAHVTLIVTNNAAVGGWSNQIRAAYPNSAVYTAIEDMHLLPPHRFCYLILNYEKFQRQNRNQLVQHLLTLSPNFIVFDEVQFVKQRDSHRSQRRQALESLIEQATASKPNLCVLGMSATPVINNLCEGKKLLEIVTGRQFPELDTTRHTVNNALHLHRVLMSHGFRYRPCYEQEVDIHLVPSVRNDITREVREAQASILQLEQVLLPAKLEAIRDFVQPGTIIYTHYVDEITHPTCAAVSAHGLSVGRYTGSDKSGLDEFLAGNIDVLVGSSPVGTGLDGLQKVARRIIVLCLPWTSAEFEQIIGRIRRQGSIFKKVEVIIPQVMFHINEETWSWDQIRMSAIEHKRTLSDCVLDGRLPETICIDKTALLQKSQQALERWIAQVKKREMDEHLDERDCA